MRGSDMGPAIDSKIANSERNCVNSADPRKTKVSREFCRVGRDTPDPNETFILKVDPKDGGSSYLVFVTGDLAPS